MRLIIFGATGGTGQQLVKQALALGHEVTILLRKPESFKLQHPRLTLIQGDALDKECVTASLLGQDAVLCALGMPNIRDKSRLRARATQHIIAAMDKQGVQRLICLSAFGAGDSLENMPWHYRRILVPLFMKALYQDHNEQEKAVMASELAWTIIRPGILHDGTMSHDYQHGTTKLDNVRHKVSRETVAAFMLKQVDDLRYLHAAPTLSE